MNLTINNAYQNKYQSHQQTFGGLIKTRPGSKEEGIVQQAISDILWYPGSKKAKPFSILDCSTGQTKVGEMISTFDHGIIRIKTYFLNGEIVRMLFNDGNELFNAVLHKLKNMGGKQYLQHQRDTHVSQLFETKMPPSETVAQA